MCTLFKIFLFQTLTFLNGNLGYKSIHKDLLGFSKIDSGVKTCSFLSLFINLGVDKADIFSFP